MPNPISAVAEIAIGIGAGQAIGDVTTPRLQSFKNEQNAAHPDIPLSAKDVAAAMAEQISAGVVSDAEGANTGVDADRLAVLTELARTAPQVAQLLNLWRRGFIDEAAVDHGLRKAKLPDEWHAPIKQTKAQPLDPAVLAVAIQRGIIPDPGILPVGPPSGSGVVPRFPVFDVDAVKEAEAAGYDKTHLSVMVGNVGLPLSLQQAASAYFRGIIEHDDFLRAVSEGNTRNEWGASALDQARQILTAGEYAELQLRGFYDRETRLQNTGKHGMSAEDSDLLYDVMGRSVSVHAVTTGLARGGKYPAVYADVPEPYRAAIQRSNIREEWVGLAYANRYTYPSAFVLRALTQGGEITQAQAHEILLYEGWEPTLAATVSAKWAQGVTAKTKSETKAELADEFETGFISEAEYRSGLTELGLVGHEQDLEVLHSAAAAVKTERNRAVTALHKLYVGHELTDAQATADLTQLGMQSEAISRILPIWALERDANKHLLTAAQVKAAYKRGAYTAAQALDALLLRGYSQTDANTYLAS